MTYRLPPELLEEFKAVCKARKARRQWPYSQRDTIQKLMEDWVRKHS